jgi:hypothetical protein
MQTAESPKREVGYGASTNDRLALPASELQTSAYTAFGMMANLRVHPDASLRRKKPRAGARWDSL